jgi:hypothetical protein
MSNLGLYGAFFGGALRNSIVLSSVRRYELIGEIGLHRQLFLNPTILEQDVLRLAYQFGRHPGQRLAAAAIPPMGGHPMQCGTLSRFDRVVCGKSAYPSGLSVNADMPARPPGADIVAKVQNCPVIIFTPYDDPTDDRRST